MYMTVMRVFLYSPSILNLLHNCDYVKVSASPQSFEKQFVNQKHITKTLVNMLIKTNINGK